MAKSANLNDVNVRSIRPFSSKSPRAWKQVSFCDFHCRALERLSGELCEILSPMKVRMFFYKTISGHAEVTRMSLGEEAILDSQLLSFPGDLRKD